MCVCIGEAEVGGPKQKGRSRYDGVGSMTVQVEKGWLLSVARYPLETGPVLGEAGHAVKPHPQVQAEYQPVWEDTAGHGCSQSHGVRMGYREDRDWRAPDKESDDGIWHGMQGGLPGRREHER